MSGVLLWRVSCWMCKCIPSFYLSQSLVSAPVFPLISNLNMFVAIEIALLIALPAGGCREWDHKGFHALRSSSPDSHANTDLVSSFLPIIISSTINLSFLPLSGYRANANVLTCFCVAQQQDSRSTPLVLSLTNDARRLVVWTGTHKYTYLVCTLLSCLTQLNSPATSPRLTLHSSHQSSSLRSFSLCVFL